MISSDDEHPLSPTTNSGRLLCGVEEKCGNGVTYNTNLAKCVPLDDEERLRYPNRKEIDICFSHLESEIEEFAPRIVFYLVKKSLAR